MRQPERREGRDRSRRLRAATSRAARCRITAMPAPAGALGHKHIGLYVYRRDFLLSFARLAPTPLEQAEQLEQLRALEWGFRIKVARVEAAVDRGRYAARPGTGARRSWRRGVEVRVAMANDVKRTKFIFVTGGVVSSLGKGLASASIGALLESRGLKVSILKMDPYINVDPGTMSPFQHGEVFVTDDGAETDLDLGHYERFLSVRMSQKNNFTTGQVYDARHQPRAARRLPRRHGAGDPAHHRRDQRPHPRSRRGLRRAHRRGRRHGRRHREPAVPRSHPPVPLGPRPRERPLRPPHAGAVHRHRRRGEDQADAAQRQGAHRPRHPARHPAVPHRSRPGAQDQGEDRPLLQRRRERGDHGDATSTASTRCRWRLHEEGLDERLVEKLNMWTGAPNLHEVAEGRADGEDRARASCASPWSASTSTSPTPTRASTRRWCTAASPTSARSSSTSSTRRRSSPRACPTPLDQRRRRCWCRWASDRAAPRARSPRCATRARRRCRSSASASACRWR